MPTITKPLLASKIEVENIKYPVAATPKLDGIRCLIINGQANSRNFKPIPNRHIFSELEGYPEGFDGELVLQSKENNSFQAVSSGIMSFEGEPDFLYCVFDWIENLGDENLPYVKRVEKLVEFHKSLKTEKLKRQWLPLIPTIVNNETELLAYEGRCLTAGFEGVILRDPNGRYKFGRSSVREGLCLKLKRFEDGEAEVIGFIEQNTNTNEAEKDAFGRTKRSSKKEGLVAAGTLGKFQVRDLVTGLEFGVIGGDHEFRKKVWDNQAEYLGKIVKYRYQSVGVKDLPRFPTFLGFRDPIDF